jgi:diguanylate cyclase (GGDEF)-like protein
LLAKLIGWFSPDSFEEEDQQAARIVIAIIIGAIATSTLTILGGLYWKENQTVLTGLFGLVLQATPLALFASKRLNACSFIIGLSALLLVTVSATFGQGIHDISIMAYPVVTLIGSLLLKRSGSVLLAVLSAVSIAWLIYGEASDLFIPYPTSKPSLADFLIMVSILAVAALVVNLQAGNMRRNLQKAHQEIIQRKDMEKQLRYLGTHDILTGAYNRLFLEGELTRFEHSRDFPISVIVSDMDNLKDTNDKLGHNAGDELLKRACSTLRSAIREEDILARIGGDEFAVLLPLASKETVQTILSRIHSKIDESNAAQPDLRIQISLGAATAENGNLAKTFIEADQRMYEEKSAHKANASSAGIP